jgi:hypothetical protein
MLLYTTFSNWPKSSSDNVLKYPVVSSAQKKREEIPRLYILLRAGIR